jgi:protein SCO1
VSPLSRPSRRACALSVLVAACLLLLLAGCGGDSEPAAATDGTGPVEISNVISGSSTYKGAEPARPYAMPDLTFTDTDGQPFNLVSDTTTKVTLVFFGYTNCPDVCPLVMSDLTSTYLHLPTAVRDQTQVVFITTDPARDSESVLRSYLDRYDSHFIGLTGKLSDIVAAADDMGVPIEGRQTLPNGGYDVGHGAQVIGFRGNAAPVIWTAGTSTSDMASDIVQLAG